MVTENDNPSNAPRSHAARSQAPVTRLTQSAATGDQRNRDEDVGVRRSKTTIGDDRRFQNARDDVIIEELDNESIPSSTTSRASSTRRRSSNKLATSAVKRTQQRRASVIHSEKKVVHRSRIQPKKKPTGQVINFVDIPDGSPDLANEDTSESSQKEAQFDSLPPVASPHFSRQGYHADDPKQDNNANIPDIMADTGWDTDLEDDNYSSVANHAIAVYKESCKNLGVIPASYFLRNIEKEETVLDMKHHGLGRNGVKPIAVALVSNTNILSLNLTDNWLGMDGGTHICHMLMENCYVTDLDLSDNRLETTFAQLFGKVLAANTTLTHITLSGNDLDDKAAVYLAEGIANNDKIKHMNLSRNRFAEGSGLLFGAAVAENSSLLHLDLSWNAIRRRGAQSVALAVKQNAFLEHLDLSWNGFGNEGAAALGETLKQNDALQFLDISNNRILTEGAVLLGKGLTVNETLQTLKMGKNPMQSPGCYAIVAAIMKNTKSAMKKLDFSDITVNSDFWDLFNKLKEQTPSITLRHGGDYATPKPKARIHPMARLRHYIDKQNLRLVDFFNRFDKDGSMSVTREEFATGIEEVGIKLTEEEITSLLDDLDKDGDGEINYSELVMGHQDFSDKDKRQGTSISI